MARASQAKKKKGKSGKGTTPGPSQPIAVAPPSDPSTPDDDDDDDASSRSSGFLTNDSTIESVRAPVKRPTPKKATPPPPPPKGSAAFKKTARKSIGGKTPKQFPKTPQTTPKHGAKTPAASGSKTPRKPFRYRPGTLALKEIRRYQKGTGHLIPRLPFARLIKEIATVYMYVMPLSSQLVVSAAVAVNGSKPVANFVRDPNYHPQLRRLIKAALGHASALNIP